MSAIKRTMKNYKKPFPTRLRALLDNKDNISPLEHKVTQKQLTDAFNDSGINITRQTVSLYANGDTTPDIDKFKFIADYFKVSYDYLLGESDALNRENINIEKKIGLSEKAIDKLKRMKKISEYSESIMGISRTAKDEVVNDAKMFLLIMSTFISESDEVPLPFYLSNYIKILKVYELAEKINSDLSSCNTEDKIREDLADWVAALNADDPEKIKIFYDDDSYRKKVIRRIKEEVDYLDFKIFHIEKEVIGKIVKILLESPKGEDLLDIKISLSEYCDHMKR